MRADWIINEDLGIEFLKEMLAQKNKDLFMTEYVKMLTHFLYKAYSKKIMKMLLPPYIIHHIALIIYLGLEEWIRDFEFNFGCGYDSVNKEWPLDLTTYAECGKEGVT